ncbi:MAG: DUF1080 domain-containing protein [Candidatus Aminicenantes bacterium]|nr:DUF1080 domain-containing protein [Candidatus Aminicenantes bacterium]
MLSPALHDKITCRGQNIQIELNGKPILDWNQEPRGKIKDFALEGYRGLQNHMSRGSSCFFREDPDYTGKYMIRPILSLTFVADKPPPCSPHVFHEGRRLMFLAKSP